MDPDQNNVELNVNNYGSEWTATEHMKSLPPFAERPRRVYVDPDKMIADHECLSVEEINEAPVLDGANHDGPNLGRTNVRTTREYLHQKFQL